VEKSGYKKPAAQKVEISKGSTKNLKFNLEPLSAALALRDALPGTQISIDGTGVGQAGGDGGFSWPVAAGMHTIGLAKAGYLPKQIPKKFDPGQQLSIGAPDTVLPEDPAAVEQAQRKAEESVWGAVKQNDRASVQAYLDRYPNGRFAAEAKKSITALDEQAKLAEQQKLTEQKSKEDELRRANEEKKAKAADVLAQQQKDALALQKLNAEKQEKQDILDVLRRYADAFSRRDPDAVKAVFPSMSNAKFKPIRDELKRVRKYEMVLNAGDPQVSGNQATVRCRPSVTITDEFGKLQKPPQQMMTFHLEKAGDKWEITSAQ
jgi:predicted CopG family antitoxin